MEGNLRDRLRSLSVDAQRDLTSQAIVRSALRVSTPYRQPKFIIANMIHPLGLNAESPGGSGRH